MRTSFLITVSIVVLTAFASPANVHYVVHEKRDVEISDWIPKAIEVDRSIIIPLSIALTQRNLEKGQDFLMDVSDPFSPNYGKHWTAQKVIETFAPSYSTITEVKSWIVDSGIAEERVKLSKSRTWIRLNLTVGEAENLLKTKYQVFEHQKMGKRSLACDEYSVPVTVQDHIDFISPTTQFKLELMMQNKQTVAKKRDFGIGADPPPTQILTSSAADFPLPPNGTNIPFWDLATCNKAITPSCIQSLYRLPNGTENLSSYGVYETGNSTYNSDDLAMYFSNLAPRIPPTTAPDIESVDGGVVRNNVSFGILASTFNTEANLDLSLAIGLVYPQKVTNYQIGDLIEGGAFDNLLDALDGSYCTYDGGDPSFEPQYPDPYPGGYKSKDCGTLVSTHVISFSSSVDEALYPANAEIRECHEYMKLGLQGVTIIDSSGDSGVAGREGGCCVNPGCAPSADGTIVSLYINATTGYPETTGKTFVPHFPDSCPYLTSVGATMIKPNASVWDPEEAAVAPGPVPFYSGGGFSNVFSMPEYQRRALSYYFDKHMPPYTSAQYNNTQKVRGIPDVSANGLNTLIVVGGKWVLTGGTSASAPIVGSIITLINEQRIKAGKGPVGFINPVLYANPWALNDIVEGGNPGCGTNGFDAVEGWDPVTGLGTPDFEKLLKVWMALP